jgi:uncharacterized membrane protein YkoI
MKKLIAIVGFVLVQSLLWAGSAQADDDDDQDRAFRALEAGEILPLDVILRRVSDFAAGVPIEVELERDDGIWVYSLEIRTQPGRIVELEVDAATGRILEIEDYEG